MVALDETRQSHAWIARIRVDIARWCIAALCGLTACGDGGEQADRPSGNRRGLSDSPHGTDSSALIASCKPVAGTPTASAADTAPATSLTGTFKLVAIAQGSKGQRSDAVGTLRLSLLDKSADSVAARVSLLQGSSTIDLTRLGPVTLAHAVASVDPRSPGVQGFRHSPQEPYLLSFGNSMTSRGLADDAGVYFQVTEVTAIGFRGTWYDGGRRAPSPHGFFCAYREDPVS